MDSSEVVQRLEGVVHTLEAQVAALEGRVEQLEKTLGAVVTQDHTSQPRTGVVLRATRLRIESENGTVRAELGATAQGSQLVLFDAQGRSPTVSLLAGGESSSLILHNSSGEAVGALWLSDEGAALDLKTREGGLRARLLAHESGGGLSLLGETGGARVTAGIAGDHGQLALSLSGGDTGVALGTTADGGHIVICDEDGQA